MTVAEYITKFDELARYALILVSTDDARKIKYMHGLSVEIMTLVDSGEVGPRTYANAVQRALRIDGWKLTNKPASAQGVATAGGNTDVQKIETRKFPPRRDRFQRNYGNRPQIHAHNYNPPANTSNFRTNEGQKRDQKCGQPETNEKVNRCRQAQSRGNTKNKRRIPPQCTRCGKLHDGEEFNFKGTSRKKLVPTI